MVAKFSIYDWKDILRVCGTITATAGRERVLTQYMDFRFDIIDKSATVYGSNGVQISRITVPCDIHDIPYDYRLLVPPLKVPAHTRNVEIHIDDGKKEYSLIFLDAEDEIIDTFEYKFVEGTPLDYESFYKKAQDNFDSFGPDGSGKYYIWVNPKLLLNALEGFKSCDKVVLNFGSLVQPFTIRACDDELNAAALVYPVRVM